MIMDEVPDFPQKYYSLYCSPEAKQAMIDAGIIDKDGEYTLVHLAGPYDNWTRFGIECEPDPDWKLLE